jgi:hypothetical protein
MVKSRIREFSVAVAMTFLVTAVMALGATGASASTGVLCTGGAGRACIQVTGADLFVQNVNGWVWNNTSSDLNNVHDELYTNPNEAGPDAAESAPLVGSGNDGDGNCYSYDLAPGQNTPNCNGYGIGFENPTWLCSAAWQYLGGGAYKILGYKCVYVHD